MAKDQYNLDYADNYAGTFGSQRPENQPSTSGNVLDQLISQQDVTGLRPASAAQLNPNAGPGAITVAAAPQPLIQGNFGASGTGWAQDQWAENQNPSQLRQDLNLDILRSKAMQNRMAIEQAQTMNPLNTRLAQARLNATGAHQAFMEHQDAQSLEHTANFLNHMSDPNAPLPSDPNYGNYVMSGLIKNPRFAQSAGGREILKELAATHDTHMTVDELKKQVPEGFEAKTYEIGPGKQSHVTIQKINSGDTDKQLFKAYGITRDQIENPTQVVIGKTSDKGAFKQDATGNIVRVARGDGTMAEMSTQAYERYGGKYSKKTLAERALVDPNASKEVKAQAQKILSQ